jgi:hypothetical protein
MLTRAAPTAAKEKPGLADGKTGFFVDFGV